MVQIKITRATVAGGNRVETGQTVEVSQADARQLIAQGKAVPVAMEPPKPQNRDEEVTTAASKRTAKKKAKGDD